MRWSKNYLYFIFIISVFVACGGSGGGNTPAGTSGNNSSGYSTIDSSSYSTCVSSSTDSATKYAASDIVSNTIFDYTININFTSNTVQLGTGTAETITSSGTTVVTGVTIATTTYGITITSTTGSAVKYTLTGTLSGTLTVNSTGNYQLYLNGVTISATAGPALDLESSAKAFIVLADGTANSLADSSTRSMTMKAAIYCKGILIFSGSTGTLSLTGNYKHGIFSNDYIRICGGVLSVSVSAKDAIRSVNGFIFDNGTLTISATGATTDDESKGIKVEGVDSAAGQDKGYIVINGGTITITSVSKGITASWDIDEDTTSYSTGNPDPDVVVNNGVIKVTTTGTPYEYISGSTTVSCSPEGIEGKSELIINSGYLTINTADDCLNAGDYIEINDGYIYCYSSDNDAIDSNGPMTINGGVIVAIGSETPEEAFDCDNYTFTITGGTFVGIAGATSTPTASVCTQNVVVLGSLTSGTTMSLSASDGTVIFAYTIPQSYSTMLLSSPDITTGSKYTVYTGGAASSDDSFYALYLDDLSYSGGTAGTSFTVSSRLTNLGGSLGFH